jgi:signal transduction histidine kinase
MSDPDPRLVKWLNTFASASAVFAVVVGLLGLAGWKLHSVALLTWGALPVRLAPNAAAGLILLGTASWLLRKEKAGSQSLLRTSPWPHAWTSAWVREFAARTAAAIVCLMGLLILAEHIFGWDLGFDQLLIAVPLAERIPGLRPGLIASSAACDFILLGSALLLLDWKTRRETWPTQYLSFGAAIIAIFGIFALFLAPGATSLTMALPAAVAFFVVSCGLLGLRATWAVGGLLVSQSAGAKLLRRTIPAALMVFGLIAWSASKALLTEVSFTWIEASLLAILCGALLVGFITWIAFIVDRSDTVNARLEQRVTERTADLQSEVAERKLAERALCLLSDCNESLVRATNEPELLQRICDLAVNVGGYRMAWVGYAENDGKKTIRVVAESGFEAGYLDSLNVTWADAERGRGPTGTAIRTGMPVACHDLTSDPCFVPWRENALRQGYRSCLSVPFKNGEKVLGAISIYATEAGVFDDAEQHLFLELANNLSYGVKALRTRVERKRAEEQVRVLNEKLATANRELEIRVQERTAQLEAANHELEAFSYSVSHDLRAPLRHVSGFSQLLVEEFGPTLDPVALRYVDRIQVGTKHMGLLVDELLGLTRVGRHALDLQPIKLNELVAEVVVMLQPESEGRLVEWAISDLPAMECDPVLIRQVLQNLLSNALKFTRPRAHAVIEISHTKENGQPVFMVRDNGIGFNMKYVDKLFGVFQRLHRAEDFEGTGIGLATVQRIVHKHGGRVWAEAELDRGAAFYFTLGAGKQTETKNNGATAGGRL